MECEKFIVCIGKLLGFKMECELYVLKFLYPCIHHGNMHVCATDVGES